MSRFAVEVLSRDHDRAKFDSGLESVDRYLKETARGHTEKGVSLTRVLVETTATPPKRVVAFFTLSTVLVEASAWAGVPKGFPKQPVTAVLLGRLAVDKAWQGEKLGELLMGLTRRFAVQTLEATGGVGLVVDAANEGLIGFYERFGFRSVDDDALRMFLPRATLLEG